MNAEKADKKIMAEGGSKFVADHARVCLFSSNIAFDMPLLQNG